MEEQQQIILKEILTTVLNLNANEGINCKIMSGGAIQENWSITPINSADNWALVLRKNSITTLDTSSGREQEYQLLKRMFVRDILVPEPLYFQSKENFLASDFFIMKKIYGITEGHKLVRIQQVEKQSKILKDIGTQLAKIHQIEDDQILEQFLIKPDPEIYLSRTLLGLQQDLDQLQRHQPVLEFAIRWMQKNQPIVDDLVLVHGDYRTGNIMVDDDHVSGILDWEFTHWGDRREDIGWFTAKCWRFGQDQNLAGGIGQYKDFMQAYAELTDIYIPEFELKFWHILAHVRWAVIAIQQAKRNQNTEQSSLELALTDYLVPVLEKNILDLLEGKE